MTMRLLSAAAICFTCANAFAADVRFVRVGAENVAAVAPSASALVHTAQMLTVDESGTVFLTGLDAFLKQAGSDASRVVKLNVVAATQEIADAARSAIAKRYPPESHPPVTYVVGALPKGQRMGIDAVALSTSRTGLNDSAARTLPAGPRVYVSGQAEKGAAPAEAAAKTLAGLMRTLEWLGSRPTDVVQLKCFLSPMSAAPEVIAEIEKVFGARNVPFVFVEWKSDLPIEIELIAAAAPGPANGPAIEYLTPPGMKASPVFARVVRINRGDVVYTAGLYSRQPGSGEQQVLSIFEQLQDVLKQSGSDLKHLAKATYFVSDDDASGKLNEIRPKFYDPARPPAASKAMVPGVGMKDRSIAIDMIGVVVPTATATAPVQAR
ncbi:MAG: Rid family hydrolase [Tepidisphaeraceae bacterium]